MQKDVLDHGFVRLVDHMPQKNLDSSIVQASQSLLWRWDKNTRRPGSPTISTQTLAYHTVRNGGVQISHQNADRRDNIFDIEQPPSMNSLPGIQSYRSNSMNRELRGQSVVNNQGSEGVVEVRDELTNLMSKNTNESFEVYQDLLDLGVCREQARGVLPQSTYALNFIGR